MKKAGIHLMLTVGTIVIIIANIKNLMHPGVSFSCFFKGVY